MNLRPLISLLAMTLFTGCQHTQPTITRQFIPGEFEKIQGFSARTERASYVHLENVIESADFEFHLDHEDQLSSSELNPHESFELFRHTSIGLNSGSKKQFPGFVVVQLHKLAQIDDVEDRVARVNDFFFARGSTRVLVTGFRGMGKSIYSDKVKISSRPDHETP